MKIKNLSTVILFWMMSLIPVSTLASHQPDTVVLQLKWHHQFQFAGFYTAVEKGYYRDIGLEVIIKEGMPGTDFIDEVLSGRANYGLESPHLLVERHRNKPVVAMAAIFQHSPEILMTLRQSEIHAPKDFISKKIALNSSNMAITKAIFHQTNISFDSITISTKSNHVKQLIDGEVDIIDAYLTDAPYIVQLAGKEPVIFKPLSFGIDFYGDILFTSEQELENHRERAILFNEATARGWIYAMNNKEEIIQLILNKYDANVTEDLLRYEANVMEELLLPKLVRPGHMNIDRWQHIANTYVDLQLLPKNYTLEGFLLSDYEKIESKRLQLLFRILLLVVASLITISLISFTFNRRLRKAVANRTDELSKINQSLLDEISERKRILHSLGLSEERYKRLFEDAPISLWEEDFSEVKQVIDQIKAEGISDLNTYFATHPDVLQMCVRKIRIININQATVNYFQADSKQEVIENIDKIFLKEASGILQEEIIAFSQGKNLYETESTHQTMKGNQLFVSISVKIPVGYEDSWKKVLVSLIDITELKRASNELQEKELMLRSQNETLLERNQKIKAINTELSIAKRKAEESDFLKTAFLSNMSHEIRTPMMGIVGFIDLLKMSEPDEEEYNKYLNIIEDNSQQLLNIISDIIDISKIEAEQLSLNLQSTNTLNIVEGLKEVFSLKLKIYTQKSIRLEVIIDENLPSPLTLNTDETRLRQILTNLLENAIKFTDKGFVKIGIQNHQEGLLFYVSDSGKGIAHEKLAKIFDRFFKEDDVLGTNAGGTGLGLSIARSLVDLLGGKIWVESEPDKGSTFYFTHPR